MIVELLFWEILNDINREKIRVYLFRIRNWIDKNFIQNSNKAI